MNDHHPLDRKQDLLCACSGTTKTQIRRLVARGVADLEAISQATGACSGCGGCDSDVLAFIAECRATEPPPEPQPAAPADGAAPRPRSR